MAFERWFEHAFTGVRLSSMNERFFSRFSCRDGFLITLALSLQIFSVIYYCLFFLKNGYLSAPFLYDKSNTFMDLYNTLFWSDTNKIYTDFKSVYPPLNFVFLRVVKAIFYGHDYFWEAVDLRQSSLGPAMLVALLCACCPLFVLCTKGWRQVALSRRAFLALFFVLSAPMLFVIERGNLIVLALYLLPFVFSENLFVSMLSLALLINVKPYFAILLFGYLLAGNVPAFLGGSLMAGAIFLFTGLILDLNFFIFFKNIFSFGGDATVFSGREVLALPSSVSAFSYVLNLAIKHSQEVGAALGWHAAISSIVWWAKNIVLAALCVALMLARKRLAQSEIFFILVVCIVNMGVWVGGYSQIFYIACIPFLKNMQLRWLMLSLIFLIFCPLDLVVLRNDNIGPMYSFLSHSIVDVHFQLGIGSVLRPLANYVLMVFLIIELALRFCDKDKVNMKNMRLQTA